VRRSCSVRTDSGYTRGLFEQIPSDPGLRRAIWAEPKLVGEVAFTEWTDEGIIRHPSFQGLRKDKSPTEVVREEPS